MTLRTLTDRSSVALAVLGVVCALSLSACGGGGGGGGGSPPPTTPPLEPPPPNTPVLGSNQNLPGVVVDVLAVSSGSGPGGNLEPGNTLFVDFRIKTNGNVALAPADMNSLRFYVSGPTSNYQVVFPRQDDGRARSVQNLDGSWRYTFATPLPDLYAPPPNNSPTFGLSDGELTDTPLLPGTYTVGIETYKLYNVDSVDYRDAGNATEDFLLGSATTLEPREVVRIENCEQCHVDLRAHGGTRREVKNCVLCHVTGAEDKNVASAAGGSPGVTIDFRVMIHKIHNGKHLPSVNGVGTNADGTRDYAAAPAPYEIVGHQNSVNDFSEVTFPVWPNLTFPMPRDFGYSSLTSTEKAQDDEIRRGVTRCEKCHGDPDGAGPLAAPAQGTNAYTNATRRACGSCHDDIDWAKPYANNLLEMPPQADDASCNFCHGQTGSVLNAGVAHLHPMNDLSVNPGIRFEITNLAEAGTHNGDGKIQSGEKIAITFEMHDDAGNPVTASSWASGSPSGSVSLALSGPTHNRNILLNTSLPLAAFTGSGPYTGNVPEMVQLEWAGDSTAVLETFATSRTPHWAVSGAATSVSVRTATGSAATIANQVRGAQNYIDLVAGFNTDPATGGFARDKFVVVDDDVPGKEEYLKIQFVDGNRIWFGSLASTSYQPATRFSHGAGASVQVVTLTAKTANTHYTLDAGTGVITELAEFGAGNAVLVSYTTDFMMPDVYAASVNDTAGMGQECGEWSGLPIESGTYTLGLWAAKSFNHSTFGETVSYRNTSDNASSRIDFLVGTATTLAPGGIISSSANCNACHDSVYMHGGGRRGFDTCILCHGTAGSEDRPRYVAANAPETPGVTIEFRSMLHKLHMGEHLANASTWTVVGYNSAAYPNNFSLHTYGEVVFPAMPDGVKSCEKCHGVGNPAWKVPTARNHPLQGTSTLSWRVVCNSCHDSTAAEAHIKAQTSPAGMESCSICHGPGEPQDVAIEHKVR